RADRRSWWARLRQPWGLGWRFRGSLPCSSQPFRLEWENDASSSLATDETRLRLAFVRLRPVQAPPPRAAHQRRPSAGAETTPTVTSSPSISPISVAQTGIPRTKFLVASIGSITPHPAPPPTPPTSSP